VENVAKKAGRIASGKKQRNYHKGDEQPLGQHFQPNW
jgi:hypothetical protein